MPANNEDVHFTFTADQAEALQAWDELSKKPQEFADRLWDAERAESRVSNNMGKNLAGLVGKYASVTSALALLKSEYDKFITTLRKMEEERAGAAIPLDTARRQYFASQKIFDPKQQAAAASVIERIALEQKASVAEAYGAASALSVGGLSQQQIIDSGSLSALIDYQSASKIKGQVADPRKIIEAIRRSGQPVNAQTIAGLGAQATAYQGAIPGFDQGVIEEYAKFANYSRDPQALGIYGLIRSEKEQRYAQREFRDLFDDRTEAGEKKRLTDLRGRLAQIAGGDMMGDYRSLVELEGTSAAARAQESEAAQMIGLGRRPGPIGREEARQRLNYLISGFDENTQARIRTRFDEENLVGPFGIPIPLTRASAEQSAEYAAQSIAGPGASRFAEQRRVREQIMGRQEITVRIQGQDGRDIPTEPAAAALNGGP